MTKDKQSKDKNSKNLNIKKSKQTIKDDDDDFLDQMILQNLSHQRDLQKAQQIQKQTILQQKVVGPAYEEGQPLTNNRFSDNSELRNLKDWEDKPWKQTQPPTVTVPKQFPDGKYPIGSEQAYLGDKSVRITSEEMRLRDQIHEDQLQSLRKAAECHRQVRQYAQKSLIKSGRKQVLAQQSIQSLEIFLIFLRK